MAAEVTKQQILKALRELKALDPDERRRIVGEAVIDIQVKLRNEGEEAVVEWGGEMYVH